jgi:hypothetical protein
LVDELGGLPAALRMARQMADLAPDAPIRLKLFPKEKSPLQRLLEEEPSSSKDEMVETILYRSLSAIQPALTELRDAGLLGPSGQPLLMPALELGH